MHRNKMRQTDPNRKVFLPWERDGKGLPRLSNFYICGFIALRCIDGAYAKAFSSVA